MLADLEEGPGQLHDLPFHTAVVNIGMPIVMLCIYTIIYLAQPRKEAKLYTNGLFLGSLLKWNITYFVGSSHIVGVCTCSVML